jgi:hypothetical protein
MSSAKRVTLMFSVNVSRLSQTPPNEVLNSDIFRERERERKLLCLRSRERERERKFLKERERELNKN